MTQTQQETKTVITAGQLLKHWQGHRTLTRRVIEAFPEKELFTYSIGGMRTCAGLIQELLSIAVPGLRQIALDSAEKLNESIEHNNSKAKLLQLWDEATPEIDRLWALIPLEKFQNRIVTFGQFEGTVWSSIFYFIDNEIHHRAQAYVYLRSLGIEPPPFWDRT